MVSEMHGIANQMHLSTDGGGPTCVVPGKQSEAMPTSNPRPSLVVQRSVDMVKMDTLRRKNDGKIPSDARRDGVQTMPSANANLVESTFA